VAVPIDGRMVTVPLPKINGSDEQSEEREEDRPGQDAGSCDCECTGGGYRQRVHYDHQRRECDRKRLQSVKNIIGPGTKRHDLLIRQRARSPSRRASDASPPSPMKSFRGAKTLPRCVAKSRMIACPFHRKNGFDS